MTRREVQSTNYEGLPFFDYKEGVPCSVIQWQRGLHITNLRSEILDLRYVKGGLSRNPGRPAVPGTDNNDLDYLRTAIFLVATYVPSEVSARRR